MRLLIDQDIRWNTASLLRNFGHDTVSAREIQMRRAPDKALLEFADREQRILATLDSDHHQLLATSGASRPSVILLRERSPSAVIACELIHQACILHEQDLLTGCLLTTTADSIRVRMLPITHNRLP